MPLLGTEVLWAAAGGNLVYVAYLWRARREAGIADERVVDDPSEEALPGPSTQATPGVPLAGFLMPCEEKPNHRPATTARVTARGGSRPFRRKDPQQFTLNHLDANLGLSPVVPPSGG